MRTVHSQLASLQLAPPTTFRGLTIQPLLDPLATPMDWLALDEALADGSALVTEVSEGGSVPELLFDNRAPKPVLLLDGEELAGAKQNRILNVSILAAVGTRTRIPVSCVEQGRWSYRSRHFAGSDRVLYPSARKGKMVRVSQSLAEHGIFASDQGEIWDDIRGKFGRMEVNSPTDAAAALYEQRAPELSELLGAFKTVETQVGAAFFIEGRLAGVELVGCPRLFARVFPKLVRSYGLDLMDPSEAPANHESPQDPMAGLTAAFLAHLKHAPETVRASVGMGQDIRFRDSSVLGAALVSEDRVAHLSAFPAGATA